MNHSIRELQKTIRRISAAHPRTNVLLGMHIMKIIGKRADPRRFALLMAKALEAHSRANMVAFSGNALNSIVPKRMDPRRAWKHANSMYKMVQELEKRFPKSLVAFCLDTGAPVCVTTYQTRMTLFLRLSSPTMRIGVTGKLTGKPRHESWKLRLARVALACELEPAP